jgi:conjugative transfer region protein (TIGR03748 family)
MRTSLTVVVGALLTGCVSTPMPPPVIPSPAPPLNIRIAPDIIDVGKTMRTSRYVTESAIPALRVRDVLANEIDVNIPTMPNATIKQGLMFLLNGTGYTVRPSSSYAESQLYKQALPLVQTNMGYMSVRQALQVMGSDPWRLEEDVVKRQIGFRLKEGYVWSAPTPSYTTVVKNVAPTTSNRTMTPMDSLQLPHASAVKTISKSAVITSKATQPLSPSLNKMASVKRSLSEVPTTAKTLPRRTYAVSANQTAVSALRQWLHNDKKTKVAWALSPQAEIALSQKGHNVTATNLTQAVTQLRTATKAPIFIAQQKGMVAIHSIPGLVDITWVHGGTLKEAIENIVIGYGWTWKNGNSASPSWVAADNYALRSAYPIVTSKDDITQALSQVLDGFPVQAQLLYGTQEVFITEKQ